MQTYKVTYTFVYRGVRVTEEMGCYARDKQAAYTIIQNLLKHESGLTYHKIHRVK